eukprot:TRINITY_DN5276_c0_g2_i1.p1 TRINITY_DN5276_c0_g2~~TRINITY_DN5276_c0_g2_i1.p1  ORF type:complete len:306 (+),score=34.27 TRINITY_DN5276_c0_g2_i1:76-993(+)
MEGRPQGTEPVVIDAEVIKSFTNDVVNKPLQQISNKLTVALRIHITLAVVVVSACFLAWHYTQDTFWWWIYPFFFFFLTLPVHLFFSNEQYWKAVSSGIIVVNLMLFVTDGLTSSSGTPEWYLFPWLVSGMITLAVYCLTTGKISLFQLAFCEYLMLNTVLFLIWLNTWNRALLEPQPQPQPQPRPPPQPSMAPLSPLLPFPWFFIPMCILGVPLVVWHLRSTYQEYRIWVHFSVGLVIFNIMLFLIWGFNLSPLPWFLFVWIISGSVIGFLWWRYRETGGNVNSEPYVASYPTSYQRDETVNIS